MSQRMRACGHCDELFDVAATGRPPKYCSATCRKAAWEARRLEERVAVAVAKAVAAEQRRAANRGNETRPPAGNRGNETPPQATGLEPLPGLEGDYTLAPPLPPFPARPLRRPLAAPRASLDQEASRAWRQAAMRPVDDTQPGHGDAGTDAERPHRGIGSAAAGAPQQPETGPEGPSRGPAPRRRGYGGSGGSQAV